MRTRGEKCQTRAYSIVDELFTVTERWRIVNLLQGEVEAERLRRKFAFLDVGCYTGSMYSYLEQGFLYPAYVGVDVRADYVVAARESVPPGRARLLVGDAKDAAFMSQFRGKFDVVACMQVIEHLTAEGQVTAVGCLKEAVKDGGLLFLTMPVNTADKKFHDLSKEESMEHVRFPLHEEVMTWMTGWETVQALGGYTIMSGYRSPMMKTEPWKTISQRLGSRVARAIFMATRDEPTGGGWYVFRKRTT